MSNEFNHLYQLVKNLSPCLPGISNELEVVDSKLSTTAIINKVNKNHKFDAFNAKDSDSTFNPVPHRAYFKECAMIDNAKSVRQIAVIDSSGRIVRLYISCLLLTEIPPEILDLHNLELLCIYGCQLKSVPSEITGLHKLKILLVEKNQISFIPKDIVNIPSLIEFSISLNPINNFPEEIINQGLPAIRNYYESLEEATDTTYLYEAKLVFVGRGFAGKTSLVRKLIDPQYKLEKDIKSTEGINIKYWNLNIALEKTSTFCFDIWDFGGQEKYDATHQFFITERTLYIFVTEARQESNFLDFDYWLNIIQIFGNNSPIIVVQNKIDLRQKKLPTEKYKQLFPNILCFIDVSCADGFEQTIEDLIKHIKEAVFSLPQVGDKLPIAWIDIRNDLRNKKTDYITYQEYLKLCAKYGLSQEKAEFLCRYFHDLGVILHYSSDPLLKQFVVINPDWVIDGAYSVLDTRSIEENKGKFTTSDLEKIWDEPKYRKKHLELLALMKNYELCFELDKSGTYIAPELLPVNPVKYSPVNKMAALVFIYQYKFMPAGIMTRFIVKIHKLIKDDMFWKHGVLIAYEDTRAIVTDDETNRIIKVEIDGNSNKKDLLSIIRKEFYEIHSDFKQKIQFDEFLPCNCKICKHDETPNLFKWETIKKYYKNDIKKIRCEKSLLEINIQDLMGEISDENEGYSKDITPVSQIIDLSKPAKESKSSWNNYSALIVGFLWWVMLVVTIIIFTTSNLERSYFILILFAFLITFPIIIAFTLVDKKTLSQKNFLTIMKMVAEKVPSLEWITHLFHK